ncbi:MAG: UDP-N-acetylmuramoyl-L-alanyl-D-glutamate--2,6-diaminopimelate ligase, partial [Parvibaculaceae bacterium]|nr:UDP-N-acetylmuramoyl-L-alanyl-D-glutamate--2,6-diaminopimelate ligase [Parvibaculaceae bacterium]
DANHFQEFEAVSWARGHRILSVGRKGRGICLTGVTPNPRGQLMRIVHEGKDYEIDLPLAGEFQASNALVAAGLVIGCGGEAGKVFKALEGLKGAKGRLEAVAHLENGASVYVDYAHTPDGLETALTAMRPHTEGRLIVVFGCGGDRDTGKRPQMGEISVRCADVAYVTDDNPRSEVPATIRDDIMKAATGAHNIGDRQEAITQAVGRLAAGDVLIVAGKGHETGQVLADRTIPFSDHEAVAFAVNTLGLKEMSSESKEGRHV